MQIKVDLYMPGQKGELPHCLLQLSLVSSFLDNIPCEYFLGFPKTSINKSFVINQINLEQSFVGKFCVPTIVFMYLQRLSKYFLLSARRMSVK